MWINDLSNDIKLDLKRMEKFIRDAGEPDYKIVHVGGTNGKGSVCQFLANILYDYRVGVYTSPHLERVNERIVINGKEINDEEIESYEHLKKYGFTYFEALTAIAIEYFKEKVDYAIFEVGMGGRLDATNILTPTLTIITNVALEHEMYLGSNIEAIAKEKAGIIKNAPVITACKGAALKIIRQVAKQRDVEIYIVGEDIKWKKIGKRKFIIKSEDVYEIKSPLYGNFQGENIAIAVKSAEILGIDKEKIVEGIERTRWPGRMEIIGNFLLDGCHNPHAVKAFVNSLEDFEYNDLTIIFGVMKDKNVEEMLKILKPLNATFIATTIRNKRALPAEKIAEIGKKIGINFIVCENVEEAIKMNKKGLVCIIGSLYLVGEARRFLKHKSLSNK